MTPMFRWVETMTQCSEGDLHGLTGCPYGHVERAQDVERDLAAVVPTVDVQHRRRDIPHRADEREDRHQWADQRALDLGKCWMAGEGKVLPDAVGHPCGRCP